MLWFFAALLGYFLLALVFVLDKLILTKSLGRPVVYTFYSTIFMFGALLAWPFGVEFLDEAKHWVAALISGLGFGFGMWTMFVAVKQGEASHINPFIGAMITMVTYIFSSVFLAETLSTRQLWGMVILLFASVLLSLEKTSSKKVFHKGFLWAILAGVLFAASHVSAKYLYELYPFLTGFVWTRATTGIVGLVCLLYPSVRRSFRAKNSKKELPKAFGKRHAVPIVLSNKVLSVVGVVLIQWAIALGSVTLVNAM
ncbi:MAG: hypothetical protein COU33_04555, partial [Candidatus Magasanikbacteria bacterium CG10_big_fil_rev_8_21_14_0_10_43_6]